jgi:hypothetical protein
MPEIAAHSVAGDGQPPGSNRLTRAVRDSVAPALILCAPWVVFLKYHGYRYSQPEVLICFAVLAVISLGVGSLTSTRSALRAVMVAATLTFFVDVQFEFFVAGSKVKPLLAIFVACASTLWALRPHAEKVLVLVAATVLLSTLLIPQVGGATAAPAAVQGRDGLPLVVHLVLDAHIGLEGLPTDAASASLRSDLRAFFERKAFRVFGAAYSEYWNTEHSIGHLVNFSPGTHHADLIRPGSDGIGFHLARNRYFSAMSQQGFALHVYQSTFLDVCADPNPAIACHTYSPQAVGVLQGTDLAVSDKARLLAATYLDRSIVWKKVRPSYQRARVRIAKVRIPLPDLGRAFRAGPINSLIESRRMVSDLSRGAPGDFFFAHFILPHDPFVYDSNCGLRRADEWSTTEFGDSSHAPPNAAARTAAYAQYAEQARCTLLVVGQILESIPARLMRNAIVIIQGDHGSRMALEARDASSMTPADYADMYSTLFVARAPGLEPGYDDRFVPITCLLKSLVDNEFRSLAGLDECVPDPTVFRRQARGMMADTDLPDFRVERSGQP